jgi:hypothetical protein
MRKWLAVCGYALSGCVKPMLLFAGNWGVVAAIRWTVPAFFFLSVFEPFFWP